MAASGRDCDVESGTATLTETSERWPGCCRTLQHGICKATDSLVQAGALLIRLREHRRHGEMWRRRRGIARPAWLHAARSHWARAIRPNVGRPRGSPQCLCTLAGCGGAGCNRRWSRTSMVGKPPIEVCEHGLRVRGAACTDAGRPRQGGARAYTCPKPPRWRRAGSANPSVIVVCSTGPRKFMGVTLACTFDSAPSRPSLPRTSVAMQIRCFHRSAGLIGRPLQPGQRQATTAFRRRPPARQHKTLPVLYGIHPVITCLWSGSRRPSILHVVDTVRPIFQELKDAVGTHYGPNPEAIPHLSGMVVGNLGCQDLPSSVSRALRQVTKSGPARAAALAWASSGKVGIHWQSKDQINALAARAVADSRGKSPGNGVVAESARSHQGVLLECSDVTMVSAGDAICRIARDWQGKSVPGVESRPTAPILVALDQVTDPTNLGAIARSVTFFGLDGLVLSSKNCARPSAAASKASAGTIETLAASSRLMETEQLHTCLAAAAEQGWNVIGAHAYHSASSDPSPIVLSPGSVSQPTLLVMGSEDVGLRPLIRQLCKHTVAIRGASDSAGLCDSLNVASAAAVLLSQLRDARV